MARLVQLTTEIEHVSSELDSQNYNLPSEDKQQLLKAARDLVEKLEGPDVGVWKVLYGPQGNAALKTAFGMRIFEVFEESETAQQLAEKTGAEKMLIVRIMRALSCLGIFTEIGEELYGHNSRSRKFASPLYRTLMRGMGVFVPYMHKLEDYLESISFKNPDGQGQNLFQYSMQTEMDFFDWLHTQPKDLEMFSATMAASTSLSLNGAVDMVSSLFPKDSKISEVDTPEMKTESVLIVDVGGGRGQILNNLRDKRPELSGRMIVQDLPKEIEGREAHNGVESMAHNFFVPQPVEEARVYFFRHIFHDWPDMACRKILQQTIPAMKKGYSRLVIVDSVLPNSGASVFQSLLDIGMMAISGMERTERHWRQLLTAEGLEVVDIRSGGRSDSVIEAVLL